MKANTFRLTLVAALLAITAACGGSDSGGASSDVASSDGGDSTEETLTVNIAGDSFLLSSQAWVAADQGYFAENGIEANVSMFGTGVEAIQGVIASQADLGHALDFAVLNLVAAANENMSVVGAIAQPAPGFHSLAVANDITGPADLVGRKIGYVEGTSEHFVTLEYLSQNDISLDDVELVNLPGLFELVGALKTGEVDAAWVWLDGTGQANDDPNLTVLTNDADVLETVAIYLIAETSWADENAETISRVLKSYEASSTYISGNPAEAAQIIATATGGDAGVFEAVLPGQNFQVAFNQTMLDSLDSIATFLVDSGVLAPDFDVRNFIKLDTMEAAVPGSVTADIG